ncbi:hypothetical protein KO500_01855 [Cellulophaga baltica]|uniref:type IX secretion system protein PorG n=1 Tax=Cellulophaga TaxID=104264 RepID=UPI001C071319|nr:MULTISPECIES: DUF6089 family protein [Cellulophaga]MBU2995155.1 hypothetical protein [Cellulophaga baltica]MDO6766550.1 DUF6089 family protein [Cellulophaga sp. 1_MG-2023]
MKTFFTLLIVFSFFIMRGQTYEVGIMAGGVNNIGDVGKTNYISPSGVGFGGVFKWNKSKRYAWRASILYGEFTADDTKSNLSSRQERAYVVDNDILEISAGLEFNFTDYNLHKLGPAFTPYLYTGITYFRYDYNYIDANFVIDYEQRDGAFAIPMTIGFKYRLSQFFILGGEIGARYTFTDNLDFSNPEDPNLEPLDVSFGNIFSNDWYVFSGLTLTYTFKRKPCSDCFD